MGEDTNLDIWGEPTDNPEAVVTEEDTTQEVTNTSNDEQTNEKSQEDSEERLYTIKVNGEQYELNESELIATAQKGADYDRIRRERDDYRESLNDVSILAREAGLSVRDYLAEVSRGIQENKLNAIAQSYIDKGIDENTAFELANKDMDLERLRNNEEAYQNEMSFENQIDDAIAQDWMRLEQMTGQPYSEELEQALEPYFKQGYLIMEAYQQMLLDDQRHEIQNTKNKTRSTGSVKGSAVSRDDDIRNALLDA